ncbi:MAG: LPS export ABC transporter periplasmic protein LptC [Gammaproteobacteria bacterium]|nr:LPS export ABC transporter periplasmic protein LptC [Gammaproteobacteria bacterium]
MRYWRHGIAAVLLAGTVGLMVWRSQDGGRSAGFDGGTPVDPGYVASDAEIIQTGPDGEPLYRLQARRIEQPAAGAAILVSEPRLRYQQGDGPVWTLRADTGQLPADAARADLAGSVHVIAMQPDSAPLEIRTARLGIDMDTRRVRTQDPVEISWGRDRVTAVGLSADMKAGTLRLESRVHGEIAH